MRAARRESRGRLKILLGASPGVGKTFEMLREGAELAKAGRDVVVGIVETHGRADTEALVAPFEVLPRRSISHGPHTLTELDIDALLARAPDVALVDELAHSNAPGSRHPKRWQDIEELRDAGIDVLTTVNIQHVESLKDVVASFTQVRVRETVPDAVFDDAEIELVDLPPDELIERLKAGKIYIPEEASRALGHFFSKSNLSALREMALRRAAQTVDRQMLDHVRSIGAQGQWAASERIVVAIGDQPGAETLVRTAKRLADALDAPWTALVVETPRSASLSAAVRDRVAAALKLAATLGGSIATVPAADVTAGLAGYLREVHATMLVIGKTSRSWWFELRHRSVVDTLVRDLAGITVHVVPTMAVGTLDPPGNRSAWPWAETGIALAMVAITTIVAVLLVPLIGVNSVDLLYLVPVITAATLLGLRPSLVASAVAALAYNFFFLPPIYTFTIADPQNLVTLLVLTGVAIFASQLAGRLKREANIGARTAQENAAIAAFGQRLAAMSDEAGTAQAVCDEIGRMLVVQTVLLANHDGQLRPIAATPADPVLSPIDLAAAQWAHDRGEAAGADTSTLTSSEWQFHPLVTALGVLAILGVARDHREPIPGDRLLLFTTLLGQAALAHERIRLEADARELDSLKQRDELRITLLSSIGHDLKTPLTSVVAAAEALAADSSSPIAATLKAEARRLRRVFDDLVEMTRLDSGAVLVKTEATDLVDAIGGAVHDLKSELLHHRLVLDVPPTLPLVEADPRLLHHILINLIGNAAKFAPEGSAITIEGRRTAGGLALSVLDAGPGLPAGQEATLFDRFSRVEGDDRSGGTGLGLAIVKGFASAMGLSATAANRSDGPGAHFSITWPEAAIRRGTVAA
ncbi:MAG: sensor histidine kinase KdpD [Sandarakinorhabdus sp.]|nr:sensor histidine kinase KdpD [Sandarakinorhabdus sp.]